MQLTRWTYINKEFDKRSRFSKARWCQLIEAEAIPGKIIEGEPYIDAARFASATVLESPSNTPVLEEIDLLN